MTDDELVADFESGRVPEGGFHHAQHVRVAWIYLGREPLTAALARLVGALKQFAVAQGQPDLYHETITVAFVLLIQDRIAKGGRQDTWEAFAAANADLLAGRPSLLARYYSAALLMSPVARAGFVWPDLNEPRP